MNLVRIRREAVAAAHRIDALKAAVLAGEGLVAPCRHVRHALAAVEGEMQFVLALGSAR